VANERIIGKLSFTINPTTDHVWAKWKLLLEDVAECT